MHVDQGEATAGAPHEGVLTRLGASPLAGVGVFAIVAIARGTNVFGNDQGDIRWIDASDLDGAALGDEHRKLYEDFAIRRDGQLGCPTNFDLLTVGWYVNEPAEGDEPNLRADASYSLIACRDIRAGEELTVRYESFSDSSPLAWTDRSAAIGRQE